MKKSVTRAELLEDHRYRSDKNVLSNEDWHPTIDGMVRVSLIELDAATWRVCVWGGDDTGMEVDTDEARARIVFDRIVDLTTRAELASMGLRPA